MKSIFVTAAILCLAATLGAAEKAVAGSTNAASRPTALTDLFGDPVLARGQGVEVKRSQLEDAFTAWKANLAAGGQTVAEDQRAFREFQILDKLIITQLINSRATAADRTAAKTQAEKFIADRKKEAASEDAFYGQIKALGVSPEQFNQQAFSQALVDAVLERDLKSKLSVPSGQVEEFYKTGTDGVVRIMQAELERLAKDPDTSVAQLTAVKQQIQDLKKANLAKLEQPEKVRVMHLLISTRAKVTEEELPPDQKKPKRQQIEKLLARVRAGEDFSPLVQQFSEDRNLKESKGEYTFSRQDPFVPEFKAAAFSLSTNQISDVVTSTFGYHLIKCLEKIPARKVEFDKVTPDIKEALLTQELQRQMPGYFDRLKKDAAVEILSPKYKTWAK